MTDPQQTPDQSRRAGVEPDLLPLGTLGLWIGGLLAFLIAALIGLWQYFHTVADTELTRKDLARPDPRLEELRARDNRLLTQYAVVDESKGVYRIPVNRAMELLVAQPELLAPTPKAQPATAPAAATPTQQPMAPQTSGPPPTVVKPPGEAPPATNPATTPRAGQ